MSISPTNLIHAKDLLLFNQAETVIDAALTSEWDQQVANLCRHFDLFHQVLPMTAIANQSVYTTPPATTRIFAVVFRGVTLDYTDRGTLDLIDPDWQAAVPGQPLYWLQNAVPGDTDTPPAVVTPREFLLHPAPDGATAGANVLSLVVERRVDIVPQWVEPILLYLTVGKVAEENPNCMQPEKGQFFTQLGNAWLAVARRMMQV